MNENDYAVVMTSGHIADYTVLEQVLRKKLSYVGVIGSRTKVAITRQKLIAAGVDEKKIDELHTPIGLAIKAVTPAEIAISIAAELIEPESSASANSATSAKRYKEKNNRIFQYG